MHARAMLADCNRWATQHSASISRAMHFECETEFVKICMAVNKARIRKGKGCRTRNKCGHGSPHGTPLQCTRHLCNAVQEMAPSETKCGAHTTTQITTQITVLIAWELDVKLVRPACCEVGACACFVLHASLISVNTHTIALTHAPRVQAGTTPGHSRCQACVLLSLYAGGLTA